MAKTLSAKRQAQKEAALARQAERKAQRQPQITQPASVFPSRAKPAPAPKLQTPKKIPNEDTIVENATKAAVGAESFEDIFLNIISFLPTEERANAFSLFSVFRKQEPAQQKEIVDSLMATARQQTGPLFDLMIDRIKQDKEYNKAALDRQKYQATAVYDRMVQQTDFNAIRGKAAEDRSLAMTVRDITSSAFTDRVAGSGIVRRRSSDQIDATGIRKEDIDIEKNQAQSRQWQEMQNVVANADAGLGRIDVLSDRLIADEKQKQEEGAKGLFLSLFENQYAQTGDTARDMIGSGDMDTISAADVLASQSDEDRRKRVEQERLQSDDAYFDEKMKVQFMNDWKIADPTLMDTAIAGVRSGTMPTNLGWGSSVYEDLQRRIQRRSLNTVPVFYSPQGGYSYGDTSTNIVPPPAPIVTPVQSSLPTPAPVVTRAAQLQNNAQKNRERRLASR